MGGALLMTLIPTPPKTAKELINTNAKAIHSFLYVICEHLSWNSHPYPGSTGRRLANVTSKFTAKTVTAVISITADTGSHDQAARRNSWYARISELTRNRHPTERS